MDFFKPNISTLVGQLYEEGDSRRDSGFTIFYMGINLGAFLAPLVCGTLGEKIGFHYGFAAAGIGMLIGLFIYLWGQKKYLSHIYTSPVKQLVAQEVSIRKKLTKMEKQKIAVIFILMSFSIFFWASFEQAGSSLTLFADRSADRILPFFNWEFPVSYFQSINPLFILLLAPLFSTLWVKLTQLGKNPSTPIKFVLGLGFVALGFLLMVFAASLADTYGKVTFLWLIGAYLFHTVGELCLSPVGLSMVTKLSPAGFVSFLLGIWFLSSFFANLLAGLFAGHYDSMNHSRFFMIPVVIASVAALILLIFSSVIKKWSDE